MPPDARIVHQTAGRLRLKFDGRKNDTTFFARLSGELRSCPGIREVRGNPVTGSVLILHEADSAQILQDAADRGLFDVHPQDAGAGDLQARMTSGLGELGRTVQDVTGGALDFNALLVLGLAGLAIQQAIEGNVMVPAVSLLWYAYNAARMPPMPGGTQAGEPGRQAAGTSPRPATAGPGATCSKTPEAGAEDPWGR